MESCQKRENVGAPPFPSLVLLPFHVLPTPPPGSLHIEFAHQLISDGSQDEGCQAFILPTLSQDDKVETASHQRRIEVLGPSLQVGFAGAPRWPPLKRLCCFVLLSLLHQERREFVRSRPFNKEVKLYVTIVLKLHNLRDECWLLFLEEIVPLCKFPFKPIFFS